MLFTKKKTVFDKNDENTRKSNVLISQKTVKLAEIYFSGIKKLFKEVIKIKSLWFIPIILLNL